MPKLRAAIALGSDTHSGGSTALMPPTYTTVEGQTIHANRVQSRLWDYWLDWCGQVKALRREGAYVYGVHVGDVTEGNHHETVQILTVDEYDHVMVGVEVMQPFVAACDEFAQVRGTETHVGASSRLETQVIKHFASYKIDRPDHDPQGWTHQILRRTIAGVVLNAAHHIGGGMVRRNTSIEGAVKMHLEECGEFGDQRADYLVRAHKHRKADTGFSYATRGMILPAWQFPTSYVHRIAPGTPPMIGGVIIRIYEDNSHSAELVEYPFIREDRIYKVVAIDGNQTSEGTRAGAVRGVQPGRAARGSRKPAGVRG